MNLFHKFRRATAFRGKAKFVLIFLNGFLFALLLYFYTEDNYEKNLFQALTSYVKTEGVGNKELSEDSLLLKSLHLVHTIEGTRARIFKNQEITAWKADFLQPVTYDLMTGKKACGGFCYVLGRLLKESNVDVRFAQMKVGDVYGRHIVMEAKTSRGWVVLDPSFDVFFKRPDGQLASFADVQGNWNYYKQQLPAEYDHTYQYEGVRYTNWDKIPVIMPLIKNVMYFTVGKEKTESYSLRKLVLRKFNLLFNITLVIYLLLVYITVRKFLRNRQKAVYLNPTLLFPRKSIEPIMKTIA
jgi:hypothetical protein